MLARAEKNTWILALPSDEQLQNLLSLDKCQFTFFILLADNRELPGLLSIGQVKMECNLHGIKICLFPMTEQSFKLCYYVLLFSCVNWSHDYMYMLYMVILEIHIFFFVSCLWYKNLNLSQWFDELSGQTKTVRVLFDEDWIISRWLGKEHSSPTHSRGGS